MFGDGPVDVRGRCVDPRGSGVVLRLEVRLDGE